jgi:hypothetical protein
LIVYKNKLGSNHLKILILIPIIAFLVWLYSVFTTTPLKAFPDVVAAQYYGLIDGSLIDNDNEHLFFSYSLKELGQSAQISLYSNSWDPTREDAVSLKKDQPLLLKSDTYHLRLAQGNCLNKRIKKRSAYCGEAYNLNNGRKGFWFLSKVESLTSGEAIKKTALLTASKLSQQSKQSKIVAELETIKVESAQISKALMDTNTLKTRSEQRYTSQRETIESLKREIEQEEQALRKKQASFEVAKSASTRGRISYLSRQFLEKDADRLGLSINSQALAEDEALRTKHSQAKYLLKLKAAVERLQ